MMEPATFAFSALVLLAKESGLEGFLLRQSKKVVEGLIHKKIQDKAVTSEHLRRFFAPEIETAFKNAFAEIAPRNKQIRRKFLLLFLTDPVTGAAIADMQRGKPPTSETLHGVFRKLHFPEEKIPAVAEQLLVRLHSELSKVSHLADRVIMSLPAKLARIERKIDDLQHKVTPSGKQLDFFVPELPANFIGRESLLAELHKRLVPQPGVVPLTSTQMVGIYGMAGVGKTYLALKFAHEPDLLAHFDGIYYQFCGENSLEVIAAKLAETIGLQVSELPPDKLLQTLKHRLSQRRALLLLDDVRDPAISELLPGGRVSTIITTRQKDLPFLAQHCPLNVEEFTPNECLELFREMLGEKLDGHEKQAAQIAVALGRLPIAVSVAAGLLRDDVRWTFDRLSDLLEHEVQASVGMLEHRDRNVARLFNCAFDRLSAIEETLLCAMAACAEEGFRFALAAEVAGLMDPSSAPSRQASACLQALVDGSLIRELDRQEQRYFLHTLVRQTARNRKPFAGLSARHAEIVRAQFQHWEQDWQTCADDLAEAREALQYAIAVRNNTEAAWLSHYAYALCSRIGRLQEALEFTKADEDLAISLDDKDSLQASYGNQALILQAWGRLEEAMQLHKKKEEICIELGNKDSLQISYGNQALILKAWGRLEEAMQLHKKKEEICIELGNKSGQAYCHWGIAGIHHEKGEKITAKQRAEQALALFTELNMPREKQAVTDFLKGLA